MKTYPLHIKEGSLFAFEIDNVLFMGRIGALLRAANNCSDVRVRKLFSDYSDEVHIRFKYKERVFIVREPFGDNSRLWVGPEDTLLPNKDICELAAIFQQNKWWFWS